MLKKKLQAAKPEGIDIKSMIRPVADLPLVISALFYGRSGTGKTTLAATFPKPALILDIQEKGTDSVFKVKDLDIIEVHHWDQIEPIYWFLKKENPRYKTVIIDQVSAMQFLCQQAVLEKEGKEQMSQRLFGEVGGKMNTWLLNFRDLVANGINVVFIAHDRSSVTETELDEQIDPTIGPRLMPSIAGTLNGAVSIIGNNFIREWFGPKKEGQKSRERFVDYCMRIGPHSIFVTKVRTDRETKIPPFITDPTYDKLVGLMRGEESTPKPIMKRRK